MTFLELINNLKQKYNTKNDVVIFEVIFKMSKKVKNKVDFTMNRNVSIDFKLRKILKHLDEYFYKNKPLGQIVGTTKFCDLNIVIFKKIFEPRSETELIVEEIINYLYKNKQLVNGADLCCGTGCMGLSIKKKCP
jgi:release factor glutamine methyltransferase